MHMNASIFHVVWFIRKECGRGNFSNLIKKKKREKDREKEREEGSEGKKIK